MTVITLKQGACRDIEEGDAVFANLSECRAEGIVKPGEVFKRWFGANAQSRGRSVAPVYRGKGSDARIRVVFDTVKQHLGRNHSCQRCHDIVILCRLKGYGSRQDKIFRFSEVMRRAIEHQSDFCRVQYGLNDLGRVGKGGPRM